MINNNIDGKISTHIYIYISIIFDILIILTTPDSPHLQNLLCKTGYFQAFPKTFLQKIFIFENLDVLILYKKLDGEAFPKLI